MTITLITGANRGIGFEVAKQLRGHGHTVYLGARDEAAGARAADEIGARLVVLDVTRDDTVAAAIKEIEAAEGRLDVLINNAGILDLGPVTGPSALRVFDTNAVGVVRLTEAALPLLARAEHPHVVTITSSAGSFWAVHEPARPEYHLANVLYASSKAAANMVTAQYAKANPGIRFNAVEPGFTATEMTAALGGGRTVAESARVVVDLALLGADAPTGTFRDEDGILAW